MNLSSIVLPFNEIMLHVGNKALRYTAKDSKLTRVSLREYSHIQRQ